MVLAIILLIRLTVPFAIPRRPLLGISLAIIADIVDYAIFSHFGWGILRGPGLRYQMLDKILDTYYLIFILVIVSHWERILKISASILFAWRFIGVVLFFIVQDEIVLMIFPNFFETFVLAVLILKADRHPVVHPALLMVLFACAFTQKIFQEYALHVQPMDFRGIINGTLKLIQNPSDWKG